MKLIDSIHDPSTKKAVLIFEDINSDQFKELLKQFVVEEIPIETRNLDEDAIFS